jgi:hypothetical protein
MKYAKAWANAKWIAAKREREVKVVRANVASQARDSLMKATVDQVKEMVESNTEVNLAEDASIEAQHQMNILWGAVEAFKGRKSQISDLVELYKMGYYSRSMQADETFAKEEDIKELNEEMQAGLDRLREVTQTKPKLQR